MAIALALLSVAAATPAARAEVAGEIDSGSSEARTSPDSPSEAVAPMDSSPDPAMPTATPGEPALPTDTPLDAVMPGEPPADATVPNDSATEAAAPTEAITPMETAAEQLKEPREAGQFGVSRKEDPFSIMDDMSDAMPPSRSAGRSKPEPGAVICLAGCDGPRGSVVSRGRTIH